MTQDDRLEPLDVELSLARTIIDNAADAIFHLDAEGVTTFANPEAERLFGWSSNELVGRTLHDVLHYKRPDGSDFPMCDCPLGSVFSTGETLKLHEDVFWHRSGEPVRVACSNAAVVVGGKVSGGVLIVRDVTERVRAEEHRKLLVNELNHRVKNTLAVVQSIARQTLGNSSDNPGVAAFEARLMSLAAANSILTDQQWFDPSLEMVLAAALAPFGEVGSRIKLEGPDVRINAASAATVTLALHELATNAAKYGALSNDCGSVNCSWEKLESGGQQQLELVWRETGGPRVVAPTRRGFGSRMIERVLASELSGEATIDFRPEGVVCVIRGRLPDSRPFGE